MMFKGIPRNLDTPFPIHSYNVEVRPAPQQSNCVWEGLQILSPTPAAAAGTKPSCEWYWGIPDSGSANGSSLHSSCLSGA